MNPHFAPDVDFDLDPALLADLRRIGVEFENRRTPVRVAVTSPHRRSRFRSSGRRSVVVALLVGCTATGALVATRPRTPDPIVSVIPTNLKVKDLAWIVIQRSDEEPRAASLVTVDGVDAVVITYRGISGQSKGSNETEFVVSGVSVFVSSWTTPGFSDRTSARWRLPDGTLFSAIVRSDPKASQSSVERLVLRALGSKSGEDTTKVPITEVARWTEGAPHVSYQLGGPLVQTDSSGVTRVTRTSRSEWFTTLSTDMPDEIVQRVDAVRQPGTGNHVRSGGYLVEGNVPKDRLRPIRRSELRRLIKQVDYARAAEIAKPFWKRLTKDLEYSDTFGALCVRSSTDVACGQYRINRLVGTTWVYSASGAPTDAVRVDGREIRGVSLTNHGGAVYALPRGAKSVETSSSQQDGTEITVTSKRPDI